MKRRKIVLLGPYPPPYGGVAIFTKALFEFTKGSGVELWAAGENLPSEPGIRPIKYRRLGLIPLVLRWGSRVRIVDSFHFLLEYPNLLMVPLWVLFKLVLRFEWIKVVHDGSLPSRYRDFSFIQKLLFKLSVNSVDEFAVVNENIKAFLTNEIGTTKNVNTVNALLPIPRDELNAALPEQIAAALGQYEKRVVSTGVFLPSYGFADAADAVERIRRETGKRVGLILVDGAFIRDESYRAAVLAGRDWITVWEKLPHKQVLQVFQRSDVFIRGFRHEGYGLSRIEAIWCGIPVIAAQGEESRGIALYDFGDLETLVGHLKHALFDASRGTLSHWAQIFRREAEENLERWKHIMRGDR